MPGRRSALLLAAPVLAVVVVVALTHRQSIGAALVVPGPLNDVTEQVPGYRYPVVVTGGVTVCLDKPGQVHVRSVRSDSDLDVTGWAMHRYAGGEMASDRVGSLAANGLANSPDPLTVVCSGSSPVSYEVLIELHDTGRTTHANAFLVDYESNGADKVLRIPYHVIMCADPADQACESQ